MAEGKLDAFKLFKVFRSVIQRKSSGMLYLTDNQVALSVRLANGHPVHVESDQSTFDLGEALVHEGLLSSTELVELNQRIDVAKSSLISTILDEGLVARRRLQRIEGRLSRLRLLPAFSWADGWFRFSDAALYDEPLIQPIDSVSLIIESASTVLPTPLCERFLRGFANQALKPTAWFEEYGAEFDRFFEPPNLTRRVRTGLTTNEILQMPGNRPQNIRQGCALILGGLCQLVAEVSSSRATDTVSRAGDGPKGNVKSQVTRPPKAGVRQRGTVQRTREVSDTKDVSSPERVQPIITAPPSSVPPPRPRSAKSEPKQHATGQVGEGTSARERPSATRRRQAPTAQRSSTRQSAQPTATVSKSKAIEGENVIPSDMKPKDKERLEYIIDLASRLHTKNHYEILELEKNASAKTIRAAFKAHARNYHVDRFSRYRLTPKTLETVQKVFIAFNRANETLSDAHLRQEYDLSLQLQSPGKPKRSGGSTGEDQLQDVLKAEKLTEAAVALLSRGQSAAAVDKLKQALATTPEDPLGLAALAYAEYLQARSQGASKVVTAKSKGLLKKITKTNPGLAEPHLYLGRLYRDAEEFDAAIQSFNAALEQNPHLTEAASELRHTRRKSMPANKGLKGLFGRKK